MLVPLFPQEKTKLNTVHQLRSLITKASVLAEESNVQLSKFTTERLPRTEEVNRLKRQVVAQQKLMKDTISHLTVSNRSKESIEEAILNNRKWNNETLRPSVWPLISQHTSCRTLSPYGFFCPISDLVYLTGLANNESANTV